MTTPSSEPRKSRWKLGVTILGVLAVVFATLTILKYRLPKNNDGMQTVDIREGETLPDFDLVPFQGKALKVSEMKAKILLINFWATWCEACMVEMPSIVRLRERYQSRGFEVIAVNVDENPATVLPKTLKRIGIDFIVYIDPKQKLSDLFTVQAIPLTVIIDKQRKILLVENGERNWDDNEVHSLLEDWLIHR